MCEQIHEAWTWAGRWTKAKSAILLSALALARMQQSDILPLNQTTYAEQLFLTSLFSDCTVRSKDRVWHLHRCILSPRCEFFWNCFQGSFEEASTATVEMNDDEPETVERMLKWIYLLRYPKLVNMQSAWTQDLDLYLMADKYGLTALMEETRKALLDMANQCALQPELLNKSVECLVEALEMLFVELFEREEVMALREELLLTLAPTIAKQIRSLPVLEELMTAIPGFGVSLVEALAQGGRDRPSPSPSIGSFSRGSHSSHAGSPPTNKPYVPLNEDSDEEFQ